MLPLNTGIAVDLFSQKIIPFDVTKELINHEWVDTQGDDYILNGKIAMNIDKDLQIKDNGDIAKGIAIVYLTKGELHFNDIETENDSEILIQSFVRYRGDIWRVKYYKDRTEDGGYRKYGCVRYKKR